MIHTDLGAHPDGSRVCLYPAATNLAWCGHEQEGSRGIHPVADHADSLHEFLAYESDICTTCVNEMARDMNLPASLRIRWVEDFAGGTLAPHLHEQAEREGVG